MRKHCHFMNRRVAEQPTFTNQFILEGVYREMGRVEDAVMLMDGLLSAHPYSPDVAVAAANMHANLGEIDAAVEQYRRAVRLQRLQVLDTTNTRLLLGQLLLDNGRFTEAAETVELLLSISPKNAAAHKLHGDLLRLQGEIDAAADAYQQAFSYDPTRVELYVALTNLLRQIGGEPHEVLGLLETAVQLNPDEPTLYLALGDQEQRSGSVTDAIAAYQMALEQLERGETAFQQRTIYPRQSQAFALLRLGQIYESLGQMETAMDYFQAMTAAAPEIAWTQSLQGDAWRRRGELAKAAELYEKAIAADPTYISGFVNLAELLYAQGDVEQSNVLYHEALNLAVSQLAKFDTSLVPESRLLIPDVEIPVFSDELIDDRTSVAEPVDVALLYSRIDENVSIVRAIVGLYQQFGQTSEGIVLYQAWLAQGESDGWSPVFVGAVI